MLKAVPSSRLPSQGRHRGRHQAPGQTCSSSVRYRHGRVEFSATGICPNEDRFAAGRGPESGYAGTQQGPIAALRLGVQEAGFIEGTNYSVATPFANGDFARLPSLAKELGELKPWVATENGTNSRLLNQRPKLCEAPELSSLSR